MGELRPGAHAQLPVDAAEVRLDRLRAQEERRARLLVCRAARDDESDLKLLGGQLLGRVRVAPPRRLAAGCELRSCALAPGGCAQTLEGLQGLTQRLSCLSAPLGAAETLAEAELGARALE